MTDDLDRFLDDVFLGCAFAAFVDEARMRGGSPPGEVTRRRAYDYYEESLAAKNAAKQPFPDLQPC